ncbi:Bacteroides conjugative transposon TraJ protein [Chitinophaga eiseniae]|uniref:Bacteroides conjugative transposon TraJ protein n=1 Tax=Chitinophaga eiseniae TaxID=634771 RepID=A0A1T4MN28_9BACT|nr:conjugative transposon protein TraJ [Chitinophaga eiseniae]SJZ68353.1 Bacteroides conjugative transposon TraJ protein [Chitinophaga eiseniae]
MKCGWRLFMYVSCGVLLPGISNAQSVADSIGGLHGVLDKLYDDMIPLCGDMIDLGRAIAAFAAIWFISSRVWKNIANAEPVDLYPLLRPFVIALAIGMFPQVLDVINGVMKPTVEATAGIVKDSDTAIAVLLKRKEDAIKDSKFYRMYVGVDGRGNKDEWYKYYHPKDSSRTNEGIFERLGNDIKFSIEQTAYGIRNSVKQFLSEVLQVLFQAASLCINTVRTFYLIVLAIMGPLVFGMSIFDGFQQSLISWLGRYINYFLWLPIANIFGAIINKIQVNMLKIDIEQISKYGDTSFGANDTAYLIFLVMGIVGYFTVPSIAGYVIHVAGSNPLLQKITGMTTSVATGGAGMAASRLGQGISNAYNAPKNFNEGYSGKDGGSGVMADIGRVAGKGGAYMYDELAGK